MPEYNMSSAVTNGSSNLEIAQSNQDLIVSKSKRKKRNWIIATVVGLVVVALIVLAIVLLTKESGHRHNEPAPSINLEDFLNYRYTPKTFNGTWVSGDQFLYRNDAGDLLLYNLSSNASPQVLLANDSIIENPIDFQLSADQKYLLVAHDYQKLYRHSYRARYIIINLSSPSIKRTLRASETFNGQDLFLVEWAPVGNALVYVFENNIFYLPSAEATDAIQITNTDRTEFVFNGIPDWVYEEEVLSSNKALWFSGDGTKLAFIRFNDTEVNPVVVPIYGQPGSLYFQYPRANIVKYPKAGTPNPTVNLFVYHIDSGDTVELQTTEALRSSDHIITTVKWDTNSSVVAVWMNRVQNHSDIVYYNIFESNPRIIKTVEESAGWVDIFAPLHTMSNGERIALILNKKDGASHGYRHVALLTVTTGATEQFLTEGNFVVTEIIGWNHFYDLIFFLATSANNSASQHLYSVSPATNEITCLTCSLKSKSSNNPCTYITAEASKDVSMFVVTCAGPDIPHISIHSINGTEIATWTKNEELTELLQGKTLHDTLQLEFPVANGFTAKAMLRLPPNMDTSGSTKYPMVVNVYGGPDSYQVVDRFNLDWGSYLAANKSIIYATIDGRGSGLRGNDYLFALYRKLGTVEVADQINVTRQIQQTLSYVDASRTAIWGWSYGGYAAGMALATDTMGVIKCAMSVAPVTDWALYDSIYTERFLGLPTAEDNLEGYVNAQLVSKYEGFRNKEYFLIHGTFDDNVHYQQSMMLARMLERNDILFRQLSYPDEDHSLATVRPHLYHSLEDFLGECFASDS